MKDHDTCVCIFSELNGQDRQYTLKNQGDVNIAFLYEQRDVCRKKVSTSPTSPANVFPVPPLLDPLQILTKEIKDLRDQNIHTREEVGVRHWLLPLQIIPYMVMEDIKDQDYSHRLQRFQVLCNLS